MSVLRWHRLSVLWKSWMFNQESTEEHGQSSEGLGHEAEQQTPDRNTFKDSNSAFQDLLKTQNLDSTNHDPKNQTLELINLNYVSKKHKSALLRLSHSEPCSQLSESEGQANCPHKPEGLSSEIHRSCYTEEGVDSVLQVDNSSEGDDSFLQREGSQRRSRRRFRRVNPKGERELITDGQEPVSYNTVGEIPSALNNAKLCLVLTVFW